MGRYIRAGDRVVYDGPFDNLRGKAGVLARFSPGNPPGAVVRFDHDNRERMVKPENLVPEEDYGMKNIKTIVNEAVQRLLKPLDKDSEKERAIRTLGIAKNLTSLAEKAVKDAKKALAAVGIDVTQEFAAGSTNIVFDSERYSLIAKTGAGSERLDEGKVLSVLTASFGLTEARRRLAKCKVPTKPATTLVVESK